MKKKYTEAQVRLVAFQNLDILTTSEPRIGLRMTDVDADEEFDVL